MDETVDGLTQASSVIAAVKCKEAASGIVTRAPDPLNVRAFPYFPEVVQVALAIVPVFPLPDESETVVPEPSLKEYAATSVEAAVFASKQTAINNTAVKNFIALYLSKKRKSPRKRLEVAVSHKQRLEWLLRNPLGYLPFGAKEPVRKFELQRACAQQRRTGCV